MNKKELKDIMNRVHQRADRIDFIMNAPNPIFELSTDLYRMVETNKEYFEVKEVVQILRYRGLPLFECETNTEVAIIKNSGKH